MDEAGSAANFQRKFRGRYFNKKISTRKFLNKKYVNHHSTYLSIGGTTDGPSNFNLKQYEAGKVAGEQRVGLHLYKPD